MYVIKETSVEWALLHVLNYFDSDFFPRLFEFEAIKRNWPNVKKYILSIDLENYAPKNPHLSLALKSNGNYRVVHQLDPIDSIIYTALVYENAIIIESYRIPEERKIACSYRIKPNTDGSFFDNSNIGYLDFLENAEKLAKTYSKGIVLVCDIVDFYNQIYLHRVNNVLNEAGSTSAKVVEHFLAGLNTNISRGVPVGPAPSILIAEAIMGDIDTKILSHTSSFVRYVDDIYIFFESEYEAKIFLHELTKYLYSQHRLVLSSDKTTLQTIFDFKNKYLKEETRLEKQALHKKLEELASGDYPAPDETKDFEDLDAPEKFSIRSKTYYDLFESTLKFEKIEIGLMKHLLRQAGKYKIKSLIPLIFKNFNDLLPVIREVVIYFERILTATLVSKYSKDFNKLLVNEFLTLPYVNMWIFTLFQNENFNSRIKNRLQQNSKNKRSGFNS